MLNEANNRLAIPARRGTYILLLRLDAGCILTIGRLGRFSFASGWYAYVGSAFGSGGLAGRLRHHLAPVTRPHWHIDYLRAAVRLDTIWYAVDETPREHAWAAALGALPGAGLPVPRFGASDCRCPAHLFHFATRPQESDAPVAVRSFQPLEQF